MFYYESYFTGEDIETQSTSNSQLAYWLINCSLDLTKQSAKLLNISVCVCTLLFNNLKTVKSHGHFVECV